VTDIVFETLLLGVAFSGVLYPAVIVRWAKRAYPDLDEHDRTILWIARLIGVGGLGVALFFLLIIVRSFSS
jgi:hypothetical protein